MNIKSPTNIFYTFFFSTLAGIVLSFLIPDTQTLFVVGIIFIIAATLVYSFLYHVQRGIFFIVVVLGCAVGFSRVYFVAHSFSTDIVQGVRTGTIITNPIQKQYGQSFVLKTDKKEHVLVRTSGKTEFTYGDRVQADLVCTPPKPFETDLGTVFNYPNYLKKDHIYSVCKPKNIFTVREINSLQKKLYILSNTIGAYIQDTFSKPHSDFIGGVLVGDKTTLDAQIRNDFIKTGTIHIVALSGYNIAIIALFFERVFRLFLKRKQTLLVCGISIVLFVAMTGFSSSAVRAGLMALIVIYAGLSYQKYDPLRALLVASYLMVLYNPHYLLYDSSFHLSFLATYGIIVCTPILERRMKPVPRFLAIMISTTLGAYILTFPYVLYFFQGISYVSIFINIVIAPLIPLFMFAGFLSLAVSALFSFGGFFVAITEGISEMILSLIHFFASFSLSYETVQIHLVWCLFLYILVFAGIYYLKKVDLEKEI